MKKIVVVLIIISVISIIVTISLIPKKETIAVFSIFTNDLESYPRKAIEAVKKTGVGKNFKVVYIPYDSTKKEDVRKIFKTALNKYHFKYFVHATSSTMFSYIEDIVREKKVFGIGSTVTSPKVIGTNPYFYSISVSDDIQAKMMSEEISKESSSVLIIKSSKNSVYISSYIDIFLRYFKGKYEISNYQNINLKNKIDAVLLLAEPKVAAFAVQKIKNVYPNVYVYGSDYINNNQYKEYGGAAVKGTKVFLLFDYEFAENTHKLKEENLNVAFINTYDSFSFLVYLIKKYKSPINISKNIKGEEFTGLGGYFKINKKGFCERKATFIIIN